MVHLAQVIGLFLVAMLSSGAAGEVHEKVQGALDWELPPNSCQMPKDLGIEGVLADGGYISHAPTATTETSDRTPTVFDIDHYEIERYERKRKRWEKCVSEYKTTLLNHFETLRSAAQYGLTEQQAEVILAKLAQIQAAVMAPDGVVPDPSP